MSHGRAWPVPIPWQGKRAGAAAARTPGRGIVTGEIPGRPKWAE
jgi:hypothetical protein